ncbi:MAG: hypothetical protein KDA30_09130 [Phycisphaerales bacterium]|nr:hypothetical protein [Phycisphaerales bacterium]
MPCDDGCGPDEGEGGGDGEERAAGARGRDGGDGRGGGRIGPARDRVVDLAGEFELGAEIGVVAHEAVELGAVGG